MSARTSRKTAYTAATGGCVGVHSMSACVCTCVCAYVCMHTCMCGCGWSLAPKHFLAALLERHLHTKHTHTYTHAHTNAYKCTHTHTLQARRLHRRGWPVSSTVWHLWWKRRRMVVSILIFLHVLRFFLFVIAHG